MTEIDYNLSTFYKETFGISEEITEIMCDYEIATMFISGGSNESISEFLGIPIEEVKKTVGRRFYGVSGWSESLPYNPISLYKADKTSFSNPNGDQAFQQILVSLCERYLDMERKINDEWL